MVEFLAEGREAFGDVFLAPPVEILLYLLREEMTGTLVSIERLATVIGSTVGTTDRWVKSLQDRKLVDIETGPPTAPGPYVRISDACERKLNESIDKFLPA